MKRRSYEFCRWSMQISWKPHDNTILLSRHPSFSNLLYIRHFVKSDHFYDRFSIYFTLDKELPTSIKSHLPWLHPVGCWKNENHHRWIEGAGPSREAARESRNLSTWTATPGCDAHGAPWREKKRWTKKTEGVIALPILGESNQYKSNPTTFSNGCEFRNPFFGRSGATTSFHPSPRW